MIIAMVVIVLSSYDNSDGSYSFESTSQKQFLTIIKNTSRSTFQEAGC